MVEEFVTPVEELHKSVSFRGTVPSIPIIPTYLPKWEQNVRGEEF